MLLLLLLILLFSILVTGKIGIANGFPAGPRHFSQHQTLRPFHMFAHPHFQKSPTAVTAVQIGRGAILTNQLHLTSTLVRGVLLLSP
jgi:hypothetical protein